MMPGSSREMAVRQVDVRSIASTEFLENQAANKGGYGAFAQRKESGLVAERQPLSTRKKVKSAGTIGEEVIEVAQMLHENDTATWLKRTFDLAEEPKPCRSIA
jgi:hypothetical protein